MTPDAPASDLTVYALHALGGSAAEFRPVAAALRPGIRLVPIDLPGFGDAVDLPGYTVAEMADVVIDRIRRDDSAHGGRWLLLGHSMGGAIALSYALDHQADLKALALSGPAVIIATGTPKIVMQLGKIVGKYLPDVPVENLEAAAVSRDQKVVDKYNADPLVHHGKVPAGIARGMITAAEGFPARLPSLTIPVLLQHGSDDRLTDPAGSKLVADLSGSSDVTLKVYDGLYHEIFNEPEQEEVLNDLIEWLRPRVTGA